MTPAQIIALVIQVIGAVQTLTPVALKAIADFEALFANGATPTQADIDVLIEKIRSQSDEIQQIAADDAQQDPRPEPPPAEDEGSGP